MAVRHWMQHLAHMKVKVISKNVIGMCIVAIIVAAENVVSFTPLCSFALMCMCIGDFQDRKEVIRILIENGAERGGMNKAITI